MTYKEGIDALTGKKVQSLVPILQGEQLKRQLATAGDENDQMPLELEAAVLDCVQRIGDSIIGGNP